ncbi:MAG: hypothetical protein KZQ66_21385 [Candidatus Thiodiazotropha sp. (ex Lucinoma aequizonata)]|nr:hypothetical protein [Candidatus Thiodiazotropha sp. (ex Lucinoma aequizonata)]MCU7897871.1 hypothetical protein [Candidatus Thiodiazotropha sp. (ex Lucinoma aequizonata)]MCU7904215.1 hypothetical protein [Candidatus Thiodiazotropha sp. (ex Lucinoma aequizonata)]MCU7912427.1 hypothetical protein [Candidatus Thiodiazotropha sp. (ex Lucinoma aequizonata)]
MNEYFTSFLLQKIPSLFCIYSPLSADEVRLRLIAQRGYSDTELPCTRTL